MDRLLRIASYIDGNSLLPNLKELTIESPIIFHEPGSEALSALLKTDLSKLNIEFTEIPEYDDENVDVDSAFREFTSAIPKTLITFIVNAKDIDGSTVAHDPVSDLTDALEYQTSLKYVSFPGNWMGDKLFSILAALPHLEHLDLNNSGTRHHDCRNDRRVDSAKSIQKFPVLRKLALSGERGSLSQLLLNTFPDTNSLEYLSLNFETPSKQQKQQPKSPAIQTILKTEFSGLQELLLFNKEGIDANWLEQISSSLTGLTRLDSKWAVVACRAKNLTESPPVGPTFVFWHCWANQWINCGRNTRKNSQSRLCSAKD